MNFGDLLPANIKALVNKTLDLVSGLMQGEAVLLIGNSAAIVIYVVAKVFGAVPDQTFVEAGATALSAIGTLNVVLLFIRRNVYAADTLAVVALSADPVSAAIKVGATGALNAELNK